MIVIQGMPKKLYTTVATLLNYMEIASRSYDNTVPVAMRVE